MLAAIPTVPSFSQLVPSLPHVTVARKGAVVGERDPRLLAKWLKSDALGGEGLGSDRSSMSSRLSRSTMW